MTRYYVLIADELAADPDLLRSEGIRLIEPDGPRPDAWSRWWLAEDRNAPAELLQHRVELTLMIVNGRPVISHRHITDDLDLDQDTP
jgi:hypothetical protein